MSQSSEGTFQVQVKTTFIEYEWDRMKHLLLEWERKFGCSVEEDSGKVTLSIGKPSEIQLVLKGRKERRSVRFYSGQILGHRMDEELLSDLLNWICNVQTSSKDTLGLIITKDGHYPRPLVVKNGELYDETRMMDILWEHYAATRVRESRRMEDVYHFLRDVPRY
ncbi:hypothetical protein [Effusibacillus consociatus]|uniref:Uncharacterized protein n=1 Tax=Effusibacillus consociatus TaxID=1117041 RepID=A0ABV9PZ86_9BACL